MINSQLGLNDSWDGKTRRVRGNAAVDEPVPTNPSFFCAGDAKVLFATWWRARAAIFSSLEEDQEDAQKSMSYMRF